MITDLVSGGLNFAGDVGKPPQVGSALEKCSWSAMLPQRGHKSGCAFARPIIEGNG
jgi:hypothetical protein